MANPRISLEQWRSMAAVVDVGGYAQAAEALHKSQSAVTYAVQKIEAQLGVQLFSLHGRKAVLTPTGQLLYRRAKALLDEAALLEQAAGKLSAGWEAELRTRGRDPVFRCTCCSRRWPSSARKARHTRIEVIESVLGGTAENPAHRAGGPRHLATHPDRVSSASH